MRTAQRVQGFDERLKIAIKNKGITQVELEKRIGVSHGIIYSYINYGIMPSCLKLAKMACVLNVSTDWLLGIGENR